MSIIVRKTKKEDTGLIGLLGGERIMKSEIRSEFDLISLSNHGITKASLEVLAQHLGMSKKAFAETILNVSVKTIERKGSDELLNKQISSHVIEIARVTAHAFEVFEAEDKVQRWLDTPNRALNMMKPIALFDIPTGLALVDQILGRIEYGVYS